MVYLVYLSQNNAKIQKSLDYPTSTTVTCFIVHITDHIMFAQLHSLDLSYYLIMSDYKGCRQVKFYAHIYFHLIYN